ncbi:hypothetical protein WR25_02285 [Diploscapter pachys]|uniref:Protein arginine N-methyltransferase n=1 Tax=Diploscapter pachys TaxID=2018661 RepID=A0A2A2JGX1_9BILA|nr:hypothetical protein WR25_02285 [Diploscapter pachys]
MASSKGKKSKNAMLNELQQMADRQTGFDYTSLIPSALTGQDRLIVEKFLRNDDLTELERDRALLVFAQALMAENSNQQSTADGLIVTDVVDASASVAGGIGMIEMAAETTEQTAHLHDVGYEGEGDQEQNRLQGEEYAFEPNAESLSEVRQRINVGWMAGPNENCTDYDWKIASYSQRLGCQLYNFISYPIGGTKRGFWGPSESEPSPPPIDLPDIQLKNHLWETYVNGQISEWIDCDSEDAAFAELSEKELVKELNYISYLGLRSVVIRLKRVSSPRLAKLLNQWLWTKNVALTFWIFIPSTLKNLIKSANGEETKELDLWTVWADFRTACCNFNSQRIIAGIHISADIDNEFLEEKYAERWRAEPLFAFLLDSNVFITSDTAQAALPIAHSTVLRKLWTSDQSRIMIRLSEKEPEGQMADRIKLFYAQCLRTVLRDASATNNVTSSTDASFLTESGINYVDVLQAPLQPLADNLDSAVYNTFEQDLTKYRKYREAVEAALKDIGETGRHAEEAVVYVLGAGRGPLVTMTIEAERNYNGKHRTKKDRLKLDIYVVEKNPNAIVTLRFMNEKWLVFLS